jgi:hypothetical protein
MADMRLVVTGGLQARRRAAVKERRDAAAEIERKAEAQELPFKGEAAGWFETMRPRWKMRPGPARLHGSYRWAPQPKS